MERLGWSQSKISRIESGRTPYNEDDLAAAANAYQTTPTALIEVNPLREGDLVDLVGIMHGRDEDEHRVARRVLNAMFPKKAG